MKYFKSILLLLFIFSCASFGERKENSAAGVATVKFCYINLNIIFEYVSSNDSEAKDIKKRREEILQRIDSISGQIESTKDEKNKYDLIEKQKQYKLESGKIKSDEELYKNKIYTRIDRALENIAKKSDIDFVFNIGEGAVYAKKEYDITEELLREIIKQKERSAPVSR
jgi:Skp family chaperone for outer membrane proteins